MASLGLEVFQMKFEQICEDNETPNPSWAWMLSSTWEGTSVGIIQQLPAVDQGGYYHGMVALADVFIKCSMTKSELAKNDQLPREALEEYGDVLVNLARKAFPDDAGEEMKWVLRQLEDS